MENNADETIGVVAVVLKTRIRLLVVRIARDYTIASMFVHGGRVGSFINNNHLSQTSIKITNLQSIEKDGKDP